MPSPKNDDNITKIHISLSPWDLTDDYNRHAGVTLLSLLEHCSQPVVAHLLYDEKLSIGKEKETEYNKACYQKIADKYNCELKYHHVELPEWVTEIPAINRWTPGSLMRLNLPDILPDVDKIIYLDCDIVVLTDIAKLWNIDISNYCIAACREEIKNNNTHKYKTTGNYFRKMNIQTDNYFNSGILIMNLEIFRQKKITSEIYKYIQSHPKIRLPDQDALNWYSKGDYLRLDKKYNVLNWQDNPDNYNGNCNIHNGKKPWKYFQYNSDNYYWEYLRQTPWCSDINVFYQYLREAPDMSVVINCLKKGFIPHINGSKIEKISYLINLNICNAHILKELLKGALDAIKWKL